MSISKIDIIIMYNKYLSMMKIILHRMKRKPNTPITFNWFDNCYVTTEIISVELLEENNDGKVVRLLKPIQVNWGYGRTSPSIIVRLCNDGVIEISNNIKTNSVTKLLKDPQWNIHSEKTYPTWEP